MVELQQYIDMAERASGLPWWCLLLLAALVLVIVILAVCLGRANSRVRAARGGVAIPKAPAGDAADAAPTDGDAESADGAESVEAGSGQADSEQGASDSQASVAQPVESELGQDGAAPDFSAADEKPETGFAEADMAADAVTEAASGFSGEADAAQPDDADAGKTAEPPEPAGASPQVELVPEGDGGTPAADFGLSDDDIVKATAGSHSRVGQSAFGIDFGFLEEYEAEYDKALEEFRRLRGKTGE